MLCCQLPGSILNSLLPAAPCLCHYPHTTCTGEGVRWACNISLCPHKSFFEKLNHQTRSILLQFTQDLHLMVAYHQTKTLISSFFLLMPPILRNGSFLFVLQSQPFYQAQLVPVTTISILRSSLARVEELEAGQSQPFYQTRLVPMTTISIWEA